MNRDTKNIFTSFDDKPTSILAGLMCGIYLVAQQMGWLAEGWISRILPPYETEIYWLFAGIVCVGQLVAWKLFKHFQGRWYKDPKVFLFFVSELFLIIFFVAFISWPIYHLLVYLKVIVIPV